MGSKIINMPASASGIETKKIDTNFEYRYQSINTHNFETELKNNIARIRKSKK
jgi:hypothetical protein